MSDLKSSIEIAKDILNKSKFYESALNLFHIDNDLGIPREGQLYRDKSKGFFSEERANLYNSLTAQRAGELLKETDISTITNRCERSVVKQFLHEYSYMSTVEASKISQLNEQIGKTISLWKEANEKNNYQILAPALQELFERKTEIAQNIYPNVHPLETMMNENQRDLSLQDVNNIFMELKKETLSLLYKIKQSSEEVNSDFLKEKLSEKDIKKVCLEFAKKLGFDEQKGKVYESNYSCCMPIGPKDVRINCDFNNFFTGVFALLHEVGHGIYDYSSCEEAVDYGLWGGITGAFHEGQARLYENIIGRSSYLWEDFFPILQESIPYYKSIEKQQFVKAINKVEETPIRVDADELTYNLHIILRFEMEKEYFQGKLKVSDFGETMEQKYKEYLGISIKDDREGILQDIHWPMGLLGYYQNYSLGNLYGAQLYNAMLKDCPRVMERISSGDFSEFKAWQYKKIHKFSLLYDREELLEKVSGEPLSSRFLIQYLKDKYTKLYNLN